MYPSIKVLFSARNPIPFSCTYIFSPEISRPKFLTFGNYRGERVGRVCGGGKRGFDTNLSSAIGWRRWRQIRAWSAHYTI